MENSSYREYSLDFPRLTMLKMEGPIPLVLNLTSLTIDLTLLTIGRTDATYEAISYILTTSPGLVQHLALYGLFPLATMPPRCCLNTWGFIALFSSQYALVLLTWTRSHSHFQIPCYAEYQLSGTRWRQMVNIQFWTIPIFC